MFARVSTAIGARAFLQGSTMRIPRWLKRPMKRIVRSLVREVLDILLDEADATLDAVAAKVERRKAERVKSYPSAPSDQDLAAREAETDQTNAERVKW